MKPISKFSNLGPGGLSRRVVVTGEKSKSVVKRRDDPSEPVTVAPAKPKGGSGGAAVSPPIKTAKELAEALAIDVAEFDDRTKRWRAANPDLYRERQKKYQRDYRKRKREEKS